jgi:hypothetical protein
MFTIMSSFEMIRDDEDAQAEKARGICEKWVKNGERITIEVDTETGAAVVLPAGG